MRLAFLALVGCGSAAERGSGKPKTETRQVAAFSKLELVGTFQADVAVGEAQQIEISGDDNLVPLVTTTVKGDVLHIEPTKRIDPKLALVVRIHTPALAAFDSAGSNKIDLHTIRGEKFVLSTSGSAEVDANGATTQLELHASGSARIDATHVQAQRATVALSGSGEIAVNASELLDVQISGAGTVRYAGTPREVRKSISGSGRLEAR